MSIIEKKITLQENAYLFLNESLTNVKYSKKNQRYWIFAIIHIVQSLELFCKYILYKQNLVFIYDDIDKCKNTVTFEQAIDRIKKFANVEIDDKEEVNLIRAYKLRNEITHFEYGFNNMHFSKRYKELFEFITYFHNKHVGDELHNHIYQELYEIEAEVISEFKEKNIEYQGSLMCVQNPVDIITAQKKNGIIYKGTVYERIPFGRETKTNWASITKYCGDCCVLIGQYHTEGCDIEECPICHKQFLTCDCQIDEYVNIKKKEQI
ncbi:MAG: hypothetical protein IJ558_02705 [Treponema sp.]|nr:hypothetical protein [Treponema sp.]